MKKEQNIPAGKNLIVTAIHNMSHRRDSAHQRERVARSQGGLKELKQSLDKKWTAFEQIFDQARNRFR